MHVLAIRGAAATLGLVVSTLLVGCASSSESAGESTLTSHVGNYGPPPSGVERPRVGVPPFKASGGGTGAGLADVAADQATTLLLNTDRFDVIERAQLDQLKNEQELGDMVRDDEMAAKKNVRGVHYLLIGKITNFRVKAEQSSRGFGIGKVNLPVAGGVGVFDFKKRDSTITAEVGIDLRLVDPSTGSIFAARSKDYTRTDSIGAFGIDVLGVNADADSTLQIDDDNKGLVLRLAIDACLREMLPSIDRKLKSTHPAQAGS